MLSVSRESWVSWVSWVWWVAAFFHVLLQCTKTWEKMQTIPKIHIKPPLWNISYIWSNNIKTIIHIIQETIELFTIMKSWNKTNYNITNLIQNTHNLKDHCLVCHYNCISFLPSLFEFFYLIGNCSKVKIMFLFRSSISKLYPAYSISSSRTTKWGTGSRFSSPPSATLPS